MINLLLLVYLSVSGAPEILLFKTSETACVALAKTPGGKLYAVQSVIDKEKTKYAFTDLERVICTKSTNVVYTVGKVVLAPAKKARRSRKKKK